MDTQLIFDEFQGGRFYRGRYVYSVAVRFPIIDDGWWTTNSCFRPDLNEKIYRELRDWARSTEMRTYRETRGDRRNQRSVSVFVCDNDSATMRLFGLTPLQVFNRTLRSRKIVAVDRGRTGWWYAEQRLLPLLRIRKKGTDTLGKIAKENRDLFAPLLCDQFELKGVTDYSKLDLGPDRKPPVWVCNLCQRTAEWKDWPKGSMPGIANTDYIRECPQCKATTGDVFDKLLSMAAGTPTKFQPEKRMQDDFYFTIS